MLSDHFVPDNSLSLYPNNNDNQTLFSVILDEALSTELCKSHKSDNINQMLTLTQAQPTVFLYDLLRAHILNI